MSESKSSPYSHRIGFPTHWIGENYWSSRSGLNFAIQNPWPMVHGRRIIVATFPLKRNEPLNIGPSTVKPPKQGMHTLIFQPSVVQKLHSLKLTASLPLKNRPSQKEIHLPPIHFQVQTVIREDSFNEGLKRLASTWTVYHQKIWKKTSKAPGLISEIHNHLGNAYLEFTKSNWIELKYPGN